MAEEERAEGLSAAEAMLMLAHESWWRIGRWRRSYGRSLSGWLRGSREEERRCARGGGRSSCRLGDTPLAVGDGSLVLPDGVELLGYRGAWGFSTGG